MRKGWAIERIGVVVWEKYGIVCFCIFSCWFLGVGVSFDFVLVFRLWLLPFSGMMMIWK
jgi:hypothetical protein